MSKRPAIPIKIQRVVLLEARHRCAACCEPTPLERAHIRPWSKTKDHSAANLIALCANCHSRADKEKWGTDALRQYKQNPCAVAIHAPPKVTAEQKVLIDLIVTSDPDTMTDMQRLRFVSMLTAYAGAQISDIKIVSVSRANSSRIRLEVPGTVAAKITEGFQQRDSLLAMFLEDFELLRVEGWTHRRRCRARRQARQHLSCVA